MSVLMALCTEAIALAPSPVAAATRFIEPEWTSPTANTPAMLVSNGSGRRPRAAQAGPRSPSFSWTSVRMNPSSPVAIPVSQLVAGSAPMKQNKPEHGWGCVRSAVRSVMLTSSRKSPPSSRVTSLRHRIVTRGVRAADHRDRAARARPGFQFGGRVVDTGALEVGPAFQRQRPVAGAGRDDDGFAVNDFPALQVQAEQVAVPVG